MRRAWLVVLLAVVGVSMQSSPAYALGGWWDFLEGLSGPGPFSNGWVLDQRFACILKDPVSSPAVIDASEEKTAWVTIWKRNTDGINCLANSTNVRGFFEVRGGRITSERQPLFSDVPGELVGTVAAKTVQAYFLRQFDPALAIGVGGGIIWFSGDNMQGTVARAALTPISVTFMPLRLALRTKDKAGISGFVNIRVEEIAILGGMQASDFNPSSHSTFRVGSDLTTSVSITFDALALFH